MLVSKFYALFHLLVIAICLANSILCSGVSDVNTVQKLIDSKQYHGSHLGKLYLQLGLMLHHSWLNKEKLGRQNVLLDAVAAFDRALELLESDESMALLIETLSMRGMVLKMIGKGAEALANYDRVLSYRLHAVDEASVHYCIGDTHLMMGNLSAAIQAYEDSLQLTPCKTDRYHGYVTALKEQNTLSKSEWKTLTARLIAIKESCSHSAVNSERIEEKEAVEGEEDEEDDSKIFDFYGDDLLLYQDDDDDDNPHHTAAAALQPFLFETSSSGNETTRPYDLLYAIYQAADKADQLDIAWQYLQAANDLEKSMRSMQFQREESITMKNHTVNIFTSEMLSTFPDIREDASTVPVFIVGMMRSGSTLLETMLDSHPAIWGMGEDSIFNANLTALRDAIVVSSSEFNAGLASMNNERRQNHPFYQEKMQEIANVMIEYGDQTVKEMKKIAKYTMMKSSTVSRDSIYSSNSSNSIVESEEKKKLKKKTGEKGTTTTGIKKEWKKLQYIVDKMLFNYRNLGFIHLVYPEAVIIHMIRDPLDTLFSCYKLKFDDLGLHWTSSIEDLVLQYVLYLETVHHFRTIFASPSFSNKKSRLVEIHYEELVYQPEQILQEVIVDRLDLAWDDQLLKFHENQRAVHTNSQTQVRQQLYSSSIGNWKKYGTFLQPMIDEFRKYLPYLRSIGALPFEDEINWNMDIDFPYEDLPARMLNNRRAVNATQEKGKEQKVKKAKKKVSDSKDEGDDSDSNSRKIRKSKRGKLVGKEL